MDFPSARSKQTSRGQKNLRLLSSCDRYNYGDLLFPIVTRQALMAIREFRDQYQCDSYGMKRSDLSAFGAMPSKGMSDLYHDVRNGDVVLLAGGENLAQTWLTMHLTLLDANEASRMLSLQRFARSFAERFSRWQYRGRQRFPYILSPDQFHANVRVMYNSVGGWPLRHYGPRDQKSIVKALGQASFVSVRGQESANIIKELDPTVPVVVAPDCVFLLPALIPKDQLAAQASEAVRVLVREAGEYVTFQCNPRYGEANREELKRQIQTLAAKTGLNVVLTPIGRVYSFNDDVFLESLAAEMGKGVRVLGRDSSIYDVAYVLASARLFCGTSLHGVITSLAYDVPFVPLQNEDPKVHNNVKSWGLAEVFPQAPAEELANHGLRALGTCQRFLRDHATTLRSAAQTNMQNLAKCILAG
ncbi:MAG: polysaccharide pyruvyl transferase family protein [Bryobacteraceae bacterium]